MVSRVAYEHFICIPQVAKARIMKRIGGNGADERHTSIKVQE